MDADAMVREAKSWRKVPSQHVCEEKAVQNARIIGPERVLMLVIASSGCSSSLHQHVLYLEHVVLRVTITHPRRGDLSITLTSPSGTQSQLLATRPHDHSTEGFSKWDFMTAHCWGEQAAGDWTLQINDRPSLRRNPQLQGKLLEWSLVLYGTSRDPYMRHKQPRSAQLPAAEEETTEEYTGSCDPECGDDGCEGPGPNQCVSCLHLFVKLKNASRTCMSECAEGYWPDKKRCKRCHSSCQSCVGSRSDQCTACSSGFHLSEEKNVCVSSCEDSYYLDQGENVCRKCDKDCRRCTSASICTECLDGTSLVGNRCQKSCEVGFYYSESEASCEPCHSSCATCGAAGVDSCKRCADGFAMENWRCVLSCSTGFYSASGDTQSICQRCDGSCVACVGPGKGDCSECVDGHTLQDGVCVLSHNCGDGSYEDLSGNCRACDPSCHKCKGPKSQDCVSCRNSDLLDGGRCVVACSDGKFPSGGQCNLCDRTCAQCNDAGASNCTSCSTDKFGVNRYLHHGECVDTCPKTHFHSSQKTCEPCPTHCTLCSSSTRCIQCEESFYISDGVCSPLQCGEGEVEDPEYDDCMTCEEGCKKCVLYNPKSCLSCSDGYYKFEDGCYKHCPAKTYTVEQTMSCQSCEHDCASCDEDECYWCEADFFLSDGKCVQDCPDGFFGDEDSQECEECHWSCSTCRGSEDSHCSGCVEGLTLEAGACLAEHVCPEQTYRTEDGQCDSCHSSCASCWGKMKNQCHTCVSGRFLNVDEMCVARCPSGSFGNKEIGQCESCPADCAQCQNKQLCTRCQSTAKNTYYLQAGRCVRKCARGFPVGALCKSCAPGCASCENNATYCLGCENSLLLHKHQCVSSCPPGHTARTGLCVQCPDSCEICSEDSLCTVCRDDFLLHRGDCVGLCPDGFFEKPEEGVCERCHQTCELCDGPESDNCDSCSDPDSFLQNGACLAPCPVHTYRESRTGLCVACDSSCLNCSGADDTSCTSCSEGLVVNVLGCCVTSSSCSSHHFSSLDGDCHLCHKYCHECHGPHLNQCLSCSQNHYLLNGTCVERCPEGFFVGQSQRCEACHASCLSCRGRHSHDCLSCRASLHRDGHQCVDTCRSGYYSSSESGACERCDLSCEECLKAGADGCVRCTDPLIFIRNQGRCVPSCPPAYHHHPQHGTCELCHPSCRTCTGRSAEDCDSCHPGFALTEGACESLCITGEYAVLMEQGYSCETCDVSCLECKGPGFHNCTSCPEQFILTAGGRCLPCCTPPEQEENDAVQQDCCNCTETKGECVLSTNSAFRNHEDVEHSGNLPLFITSSILLVLALISVLALLRHSLSKRHLPDSAVLRGYEKLGHAGGRDKGATPSKPSHSAQASTSSFRESQLVDLSQQKRRPVEDEDDDDEDDEDIVYMGQDGTVYHKFRYGQLGDEQEDELEYDDESYNYR